MARVDAMSLMASSAKNLTGAAAAQNVRKVEGKSDAFGQYLSGKNESSAGQVPVKKEDVSREPVFSGQPKSHAFKKKEYVSDMGNDASSTADLTAGTMSIAQASEIVSEIRQMVKTELGTDDAAIDRTLKAMGLTIVDLFNPDTLKAFVLQLKGAQSMDLLTDELLLKSLQSITELMENYSEDNSTGLLALMQLLDTQTPLEELVEPEVFEDFMKQLTGDSESELFTKPEVLEIQEENTTGSEQAVMLEKPESLTLTKEAVTEEKPVQEEMEVEKFSVLSTEGKQENKESSENSGMNLSDGRTGDEDVSFIKAVSGADAEDTADSGDTESSGEEFFTGRDEAEDLKELRSTDHEQTPLFSVNAHHQVQQGNIGKIAEASFQSSARMLQALDITRQVSEQMRSSLSEGVTRLEMQLNPESLGKVLLTVSAKEGVMTATFRVQTEDARQALESQMFTLRENLEAKNIKVEAVDVQISNFDFAPGGEAERQWKEEMAKKGKKNFDFDVAEEDEPESKEKSAEEVRRSVMRDRGSSIDFTA